MRKSITQHLPWCKFVRVRNSRKIKWFEVAMDSSNRYHNKREVASALMRNAMEYANAAEDD